MWLFWIALILCSLAAGYALVAWTMMVRVATRPARRNPDTHPDLFSEPPAELNIRPLRLTAADGVELDALFMPAGDAQQTAGTVVMLHGIADCKEGLLPLAEELVARGLNAMLIDFRGHGRSGDSPCTYGHGERADVRAAVDWVEANVGGRIGLFGMSLGAAVALLAAANDGRIAPVVGEGPYARLRRVVSDFAARGGALRIVHGPGIWLLQQRFGFELDKCDPAAAAERIACPVLLIHGLADRHISADSSREIADILGEQAELWLVPNAIHSACWTWGGNKYPERIAAFLRQHLAANETAAALDSA